VLRAQPRHLGSAVEARRVGSHPPGRRSTRQVTGSPETTAESPRSASQRRGGHIPGRSRSLSPSGGAAGDTAMSAFSGRRHAGTEREVRFDEMPQRSERLT
jgi:hypothetical protein